MARLITIRELSGHLVVSERTLRRWVRAKRFRYGVYHSPGGGARWIRFDLQAIRQQMAIDAARRGKI